jgi:hypothetical protein
MYVLLYTYLYICIKSNEHESDINLNIEKRNEHRLVYKISGTKRIDQKCTIIQCRFHYDDK